MKSLAVDLDVDRVHSDGELAGDAQPPMRAAVCVPAEKGAISSSWGIPPSFTCPEYTTEISNAQ